MPASTNNELILIGGHLSDEVIEYLAQSAGKEAGVVMFAQDSGSDQYFEEKSQAFARFGCKLRNVQSSNDLEGLSLVLYAGGDQHRLAKKLKSTGLHSELVAWWRKGEVILAGTSAGAMVLCGVMLEDASDDTFGKASVALTHGLGPIGSSFIVPHWGQWTKPEWRQQLLKAHSAYYIFGIDEGTAMIWRAGNCRVLGTGKVYARGMMNGDWGSGEEFDIARRF